MFFPPQIIGGANTGITEYAMGFPFHFIWYRNFGEFVSNKFLLFTPEEFLKTEINLIYYFLSVLLTYLVIIFIKKIYTRIRKSSNHVTQ